MEKMVTCCEPDKLVMSSHESYSTSCCADKSATLCDTSGSDSNAAHQKGATELLVNEVPTGTKKQECAALERKDTPALGESMAIYGSDSEPPSAAKQVFEESDTKQILGRVLPQLGEGDKTAAAQPSLTVMDQLLSQCVDALTHHITKENDEHKKGEKKVMSSIEGTQMVMCRVMDLRMGGNLEGAGGLMMWHRKFKFEIHHKS